LPEPARRASDGSALETDGRVVFVPVDLTTTEGPIELIARAADLISPGPVKTTLWLGDHGMAQTVAQAVGVKPGDVAANAAADTVT